MYDKRLQKQILWSPIIPLNSDEEYQISIFTGKLDDYGNEIYTNDYIEAAIATKHDGDSHIVTGVVLFGDGGFWVSPKGLPLGHPEETAVKLCSRDSFCRFCEVFDGVKIWCGGGVV